MHLGEYYYWYMGCILMQLCSNSFQSAELLKARYIGNKNMMYISMYMKRQNFLCLQNERTSPIGGKTYRIIVLNILYSL